MWYERYGPLDWAILALLGVFLLAALGQIVRLWRPRFVRGLLSILLPLLAALALAYWPWAPVVREYVIPIAGLREPVTIAQLNDVHLTRYMPVGWRNRRCAERAVELVKAVKPDFVVLAGDYVLRAPDLEAASKILSPLGEAYPTFAVLGNHEYWDIEWPRRAKGRRGELPRNRSDWAKLLNARVLSNEACRAPGGVWIVGIDDPTTGQDDMAKALRGVPAGAVRIVVAHTPDYFRKAARAGADVMLTAHTHGGQVWLPVVGPVYVQSQLVRDERVQLAAGCHWVPRPGGKRTYIITSPGTGVALAVPLRLGCPGEVTKVRLVPADSPAAKDSECARADHRLEFHPGLGPG